MSQTRISVGCFTVAVTDQLLIVSVDVSALPPALEKPSLHKHGLRADHLTIPFEPRTSGPRAGTFWVHLTYPDRSRIEVAALDPEAVRSIGGAFDAAFGELLREQMQTTLRKVDAAWLAERGYDIVFMKDEDSQALIDSHFKQGKGKYRISLNKLEKAGEEAWIAAPSILDNDDFLSNLPNCIQALCLNGDEPSLYLWHFSSDSEGNFGWYAAPGQSFVPPPASLLEIFWHGLGPGFWDAIQLICRELGVPLDEVFFQAVEAMKTGQFDSLFKDFTLETAA